MEVCWQVADWPRTEYGKFYNGDSYIILNTYKEEGGDVSAMTNTSIVAIECLYALLMIIFTIEVENSLWFLSNALDKDQHFHLRWLYTCTLLLSTRHEDVCDLL